MLVYDIDSKNKMKSSFWTELFQKEHTHKFWELTILCNGTFTNILNQKERRMNKYDVVLVHPKDIHRLKPVPNSNIELYNLIIDIPFFTEFCDHIYKGFIDELLRRDDLYVTLSAHHHEKIVSYIRCANATDNPEEQHKYHSIALSLLLPEFINPKEVSSQSAVTQAVTLMSHPNNMRLTVKEIAAQIGYTPEHLTRLFKIELNDTPSNYFLDLKMQYVKVQLQQTDRPLEDISKAIGISSIQHFYRIFKDYYKILPSAMRKR